MEIARRPFQGVLNILSFNRHFYAAGLGALTLIIFSRSFIDWPTSLYWPVIAAFVYGLIAPLVVSAYVYDLSGYYEFKWLADCHIQKSGNEKILNINAGFDETSFIIEHHFPNSKIFVFDFYDAKRHTEPAIVRARKVSHVFPNTKQIESGSIPMEDKSVDIIFLLSALHEIRSHAEKISFLTECRRVCKPDAKLIMVEHLRDFPNFLAFSIGFTHFFSRATWNDAFERSGFSIEETKFTPFMSIFNCNPKDDGNPY